MPRLNRRNFIGAIAAASVVSSTATVAKNGSLVVNGVPYPSEVRDLASFQRWISTIDRPEGSSDGPFVEQASDGALKTGHRELSWRVIYKEGDETSLSIARVIVFQTVALQMFEHIAMVPKGKIVWRIPIEEGIYKNVIIPSDLSGIISRPDAEKLKYSDNVPDSVVLADLKPNDNYAVSFFSDQLIPISDETRSWSRISAYVRYSVVWNEEVYPYNTAYLHGY